MLDKHIWARKDAKVRQKTKEDSELFILYVYFLASRYILDGMKNLSHKPIFIKTHTQHNMYKTIAQYIHTHTLTCASASTKTHNTHIHTYIIGKGPLPRASNNPCPDLLY
jgi:hypothetical protein